VRRSGMSALGVTPDIRQRPSNAHRSRRHVSPVESTFRRLETSFSSSFTEEALGLGFLAIVPMLPRAICLSIGRSTSGTREAADLPPTLGVGLRQIRSLSARTTVPIVAACRFRPSRGGPRSCWSSQLSRGNFSWVGGVERIVGNNESRSCSNEVRSLFGVSGVAC
jgi:hypothetical protein